MEGGGGSLWVIERGAGGGTDGEGLEGMAALMVRIWRWIHGMKPTRMDTGQGEGRRGEV